MAFRDRLRAASELALVFAGASALAVVWLTYAGLPQIPVGAVPGGARSTSAPAPSLITTQLTTMSISDARQKSGLPLPGGRMLGSWHLTAASYSDANPVGAVHVRYQRAGASLLALVFPTRVIRPDFTGLRTEDIDVGGRQAKIIWGHQRRPDPSGIVVDEQIFEHQIRAVFEHGNSLVTLVGDARELEAADLIETTAAWIREAH